LEYFEYIIIIDKLSYFFFKICERVNHQGWKVVHDELGRMGPYAHKGTQWVSYDDAAIIRKKAQLMRSLDLGGGMVWALDLDDFRNRCGNGVHPLLHEIHDVLKDSPSLFEPTSKFRIDVCVVAFALSLITRQWTLCKKFVSRYFTSSLNPN